MTRHKAAKATAPETNRITPKLAASIPPPTSPARVRTEFAAKASMVRAVSRNTGIIDPKCLNSYHLLHIPPDPTTKKGATPAPSPSRYPDALKAQGSG